MIWVETPTNPTMKIVDIEEVCKMIHKYDVSISHYLTVDCKAYSRVWKYFQWANLVYHGINLSLKVIYFVIHFEPLLPALSFVFKLVAPFLKCLSEEVQTQPVFTCSKSTMETPEQCVKFVQS